MSSAAVIEYESSQDAPPACLPIWLENPYRLVSLWNMLRFYAEDFCYATSIIGQIYMDLQSKIPQQSSVDAASGALISLASRCETIGLAMTARQIVRVQELLQHGHYPFTPAGLARYGRDLADINGRLIDELKLRHFFAMDVTRTPYYEQGQPLFGLEVAASFRSTAYDIEEAGKCYALYRSTACVFHLMRILERGLSVMAAQFGVPSDHTNWHNIIEGIEKAIRNMGSGPAKPPDWKEHQEFFSQAASNFMVIKDAWRNYTAHARGKYTEEEAETLLINVRMFMQRLAARLHE
jgi:hypothetical protein